MNSICMYFGLALVFLLSQAHAQSTPVTYAEKTGQSWLTNYYGKTLSSLGEITSIKIEQSRSASPTVTNQMHLAVEIIEHSKIRDYYSLGVAFVAPDFTIDYAGGLHVRASHYAATITLPSGQEGNVVLAAQDATARRGMALN